VKQPIEISDMDKAENWYYVGEGAKNIVVGYQGDIPLVLRLTKKDITDKFDHEAIFINDFVTQIMRPLLGNLIIVGV
jgi:hypothetical protein